MFGSFRETVFATRPPTRTHKSCDPTVLVPSQEIAQDLLDTPVFCGGRKSVAVGLSVSLSYGSFRKLGVPCFGVLIIRILLFRVLH